MTCHRVRLSHVLVLSVLAILGRPASCFPQTAPAPVTRDVGMVGVDPQGVGGKLEAGQSVLVSFRANQPVRVAVQQISGSVSVEVLSPDGRLLATLRRQAEQYTVDDDVEKHSVRVISGNAGGVYGLTLVTTSRSDAPRADPAVRASGVSDEREIGQTRDVGQIGGTLQKVGERIAAGSVATITFQPQGPLQVTAETLSGSARVEVISPEGVVLALLSKEGDSYRLSPQEGKPSVRVTGGSLDSVYGLVFRPDVAEAPISTAPVTAPGTGGIYLFTSLLLVVAVAMAWLVVRKIGFRKALVRFVLLAASLALGLAVSEIALRIRPVPLSSFNERLQIKPDADTGYVYAANATFLHRRDQCLAVQPITTNSEGFRDREWRASDERAIAIVGDSFMAALEVPDGNNTADLMESLLDAPVLNFGVSGYGPITELANYRKYVRPLRPRIVLHYFTIANDVSDSNAAMMAFESGRIYQPTGFVVDGKLVTTPALDLSHMGALETEGTMVRVLRRCHLCRVISNGTDLVNRSTASLLPPATPETYPGELQEYIRSRVQQLRDYYGNGREQDFKFDAKDAIQTPAVWAEAWMSAEKAVEDLAREVAADGGVYVLIVVPTPGYETAAARARLRDLANRGGFRFLDATDAFLRYQQRFAERLTYSCDGHWNVTGHVLMATETLRFLADGGLLALDESTASMLRTRMDSLQSLSPRELLGDDAYSQVFSSDMAYTGGSRIADLLR